MTPEQIARVCHEVNRAYCQALSDNSQPVWEDAPDWQKASVLKGVEQAIVNPDATPEWMHESWAAHKRAEGWRYGSVKDPAAKKHPCLAPYQNLPASIRAQDNIFLAVVKALVQSTGIFE